jgi:hypothetical protein
MLGLLALYFHMPSTPPPPWCVYFVPSQSPLELYFQNWVVRSASEVEQNIVSVERISHQIQEKSEAPYEVPTMKPAGVWPSQGTIEFK